jgi:hypothetical protein
MYKSGPIALTPAAVSLIRIEVICATQGALSANKTKHTVTVPIL